MKSQINKLISIFACVCLLLTALVVPTFAAGETASYVKVTEAPADWSGDYLIVCEGNKKVYNGALTDLKKTNGIDVTITDSKIEATDAMKAAQFTIAAVDGGYSIQSASGYYIGRTSANTDSNDLLFSTSTVYVNAISMSGNDVNIVSGNTYLRWNNSSSIFRYYKSGTYTNQAAITLYKLEETTPPAGGDEDTCNHDGDCSYEPNGDETHKVICDTCTETITEVVDCTDGDVNGKCDTCGGDVALPDDGGDEGGETPATTEIALTVNSLGLASNSYSAGTATVDGVSFEWEQLGNYGDGIQVRDSSKGTSILWNTTATAAPIKEIKLVYSSTKDVTYSNANAEIFSFGNEAGTYTSSTKLSTTAGVKEYTITPDAETYTFLKFEHDLSYSMYWDSITIVLAGDEGGDEGDEGDDTPDVPAEIPVKTIAEILAMADSSDKFIVTAEIVDTYRDTWATYGNFILKDDSTDETIICYGLADEAGNRYDAMETKPVVGDTIKVQANRSSYNGVGQLANAVLLELTPATPDEGGDEGDDTPDVPAEIPVKTIAEVLAMADSSDKFIVTAEIVDTYRDTWATYGNFILKDDSTDETIICYGLADEAGNRYDAMETKPVVGDTIKVQANRSSYNGVGQLANAVLLELIPGEGGNEGGDEGGEDDTPPVELPTPDETNTLTITEAIELGLTKEHNTYTDEKYYVTGVIASVYDKTYGNMYIEDEDGNILTIYGTYSADGEIGYANMETKPVAGDTVTIYGKVGQYNNAAQIKNGWIVDHILGEGEPESNDPAADSVLTVKEAIDLGLSKLHNVFTDNMYYVTGEITEIYDEMYGNMRITDAEGNILTLYGTFDEDGNRFDAMEVKPEVGDTITVYGIIGQYNGTPQMKDGVFTTAPATDDGDDDGITDGDDDGTTDGTTGGTTDGTTTGTGSTTDTNTDGATTSPDTSDNIGACAVMAIAAAAVVLYTSKKR